VVVGRSDETAATAAFQQYLAEAGGWTGGTGTTFTGRATRTVRGDSAMLTAIETIDGAIGYTPAQDSARSRAVRLAGVAPDQEAVAIAITSALPADELALDPADLYGTEAAGAYPLVLVSYAVACADEPVGRDFLRTSLDLPGNGYVFPSGEWADRLAAALR
jgi:phosphate transport system substrate-binding protein